MKNLFKAPSSSKTSQFYDDLMTGSETRGILGKDSRFNSHFLLQKKMLDIYFDQVIKKHLNPNDKLLDFGCGPGSFSVRASKYCSQVSGVDISQQFIDSAKTLIQELNLSNVEFYHTKENENLPFPEKTFDAILLMDVIHHLDDIQGTLQFALKYLKADGKILIYEPNKLNPMIALVHLLDRNEWGLLKLGTPRIYRKILGSLMDFQNIEFNGIVIGPSSKVFDLISRFLNSPWLYPVLGWLNPKIFLLGGKKDVHHG